MFEYYAGEHPVLIDLIGICAQLMFADRMKKMVVLDYIGHIVGRLQVPYDEIMAEMRNVMNMRKAANA